MKKYITAALLFCAALTAACSKETAGSADTGDTGALEMRVSATRAEADGEYDPLQRLAVRIYRASGELLRQYTAETLPSRLELVAGVFYNRLAAGMKLQSSVTVCYAIDKEKDDDWMACEVNPDFDSPYNTYRVEGLPPGPILNPGRDAIQAVLQPQASDYLYFMADVKGDGTVYYAKTYAEHQANVRKYLK